MSIPKTTLLPLAILMIALVPVGTALAGTGQQPPQSQSQKQQSPQKTKRYRSTPTVVKYQGAYRGYSIGHPTQPVVRESAFVWVRVAPGTNHYKNESPKYRQPTKKPSKRTQWSTSQNTQQSVAQKPGK